MAHYGYLPNIQRLQLKAMGVQSVVDLDKAAKRAEDMGVDIYIPGLPPEASTDPEPEPEPEPETTIGSVSATVNDIEYNLETKPPLTVLMNDPLPVVVSIAGDAKAATYSWAASDGYALTVSEQAATTSLTLTEEGEAAVTCTIADDDATDSPQLAVINFNVVNAKVWQEMQSK